MDFGPSAPPPDPNMVRREKELERQEEQQKKDLERQRIKSMRGRGGGLSMFTDLAISPENQNRNILG